MKSRQASAASTSTSRGRRRLARAVHRLARAQQRLRRDARPVGALAAHQLALDDRDAQAALGERAGAVLARRARRRARSRRSRCSYASPRRRVERQVRAYQSGQSASASPVSSCSPCAAACALRAVADSACPASGREPGRDLLDSQPLPSGSLNERTSRSCVGRGPSVPGVVEDAGRVVEELAHRRPHDR